MSRTMKECGFPIIDEMIRDIKTTLTLVSSKPSVRGVVSQTTSSYQIGESSSWGAEIVNPGSYFSSVFKSAKEKAVNFTWSKQDPELQVLPSVQADERPLSSQVENEILEECNISADDNTQQLLSAEGNFDEFRDERKTLLEKWLTSPGSVKSVT
ncbi:uncharacterized protein LOC141586717 [Silene latifolia]|uniref:uncharacterized protein LOC141586717 n=1 Tax=Silene latifolia TaxID=37657 RepID=UPI003D77DBF2